MINDKMTIQNHIGNIDKKLKKYFEKNYILNKRFFSVKSIMLILDIFINLDYYMVYLHL